MFISKSISVETLHRIQNAPSMTTNEEMLSRRNRAGKPVGQGTETYYEPTARTTQITGPVEKTPYGDGSLFEKDYRKVPKGLIEKRLNKKRKRKNSKYIKNSNKLNNITSQTKLIDYIRYIDNSFVDINVFHEEGNIGQNASGSGFFVTKNHIITCAHVLLLTQNHAENEKIVKEIRIQAVFKGNILRATLLYYDAIRDFVILYVDASITGEVVDIKPINLGNSGNLKRGESIILVGNPLDSDIKEPTITYGIVSNTQNIDKYGNFIVDAEALEGMSGGMCYSVDRGAIIGIVTAYFSNYEQHEGGSSAGTTLTLCLGIDYVKTILKKYKIPFFYRENKEEL